MADVGARVRARVVVNNVPELRGAMRRNAEAYVAKAARDVQANAQQGIRGHDLIDTGNLLNSVQVIPGAHSLQKFVQVGAHYGLYHEMGTRFMPARPFLLPAAEKVHPPFVRAFEGLFR